MNCAKCQKEIVPDSYFCTWCSDFVPIRGQGSKPSLFRRWFALVMDPFLAIAAWFVAVMILSDIFGHSRPDLVVVGAVLFVLAYITWYLLLIRQGMTPGKKCMGLQVVNPQTGQIPGYGKMLIRETAGRVCSGLFLGLGYFWALFDKNGQAWHDKLAGTVVIRRTGPPDKG